MYDNGLNVFGKLDCDKLLCMICDAPIRSLIRDIVSHTASRTCERCCQWGVWIENRQTYQEKDVPLRTDEQFRLRNDPSHHLVLECVLAREKFFVRTKTIWYD